MVISLIERTLGMKIHYRSLTLITRHPASQNPRPEHFPARQPAPFRTPETAPARPAAVSRLPKTLPAPPGTDFRLPKSPPARTGSNSGPITWLNH